MSVVKVPLTRVERGRLLLPCRSRGGPVITIGRCPLPQRAAGARREGQANHTTKLRCRSGCGCLGVDATDAGSTRKLDAAESPHALRQHGQDHVKVAEQIRSYAERVGYSAKAVNARRKQFRIVFLAVTHIAVTIATECLPMLALFALVNSGPTGF
jgi:hypothetical protein